MCSFLCKKYIYLYSSGIDFSRTFGCMRYPAEKKYPEVKLEQDCIRCFVKNIDFDIRMYQIDKNRIVDIISSKSIDILPQPRPYSYSPDFNITVP